VESKSTPLGATLTPGGVNFALFSEHAAAVFLLLFDEPDKAPTDVIELTRRDKFVWHVFVKGLKAGQLYGYKVRGDYRPEPARESGHGQVPQRRQSAAGVRPRHGRRRPRPRRA
jgi:glycogen operon protein